MFLIQLVKEKIVGTMKKYGKTAALKAISHKLKLSMFFK